MCILQLEIIRKQKIMITSHSFGLYHYTFSPSPVTANKNSSKNEASGIRRKENADQPAEQLGLMTKLLCH